MYMHLFIYNNIITYKCIYIASVEIWLGMIFGLTPASNLDGTVLHHIWCSRHQSKYQADPI